jgi:hypothetical protein
MDYIQSKDVIFLQKMTSLRIELSTKLVLRLWIYTKVAKILLKHKKL